MRGNRSATGPPTLTGGAFGGVHGQATDTPGRRPAALAAAALAVFAALFPIFAATACRTVGPGDSGELAVALSTWGVAHAPGFPLLCLVGNLFSLVPHPGEPALALNLLSSCFGALACAVLALAVARLSGRVGAGVAAGLALGTTRLFWQYSLVIEVFSFNALLAAVMLLCLAWFVRSVADRRPVLWPLPLSALVAAGVVTHQPTLVLVAAPVLIVEAALAGRLSRLGVPGRVVRRTAAASLLAGLVGLLPLLYLPLAARRDPALNWGDIRGLTDFIQVFLRSDFGSSTLIGPAITASQILEKGESASPLGLRHHILFWTGVPGSLGWLLTALIPLGIPWAIRHARAVAAFVALFLTALILFLSRVNTPIVPLYLGITEAFYVLPHVVLAFIGGLGLAWLMERARPVHARAPAVLCLVVALAAVAPNLLGWRRVDMSGNTFTRDFGANLMSGIPQHALLLSDGDLFRNSVRYQQECLGRRRDVTLVEQRMLGAEWYVRQLRRRRAMRLPETMRAMSADPSTQSKAWLDLNLEAAGPDSAGLHEPQGGAARRPIVATTLIDSTYASAYRLVPMGLYSQVLPKERAVDPVAWADRVAAAARRWELGSLVRVYAETSWEHSESIFYTYALAHWRALEDLAGMTGRSVRAEGPVPGGAHAASWVQANRAGDLAYQAEFWRLCRVDSAAWVPRPADSTLVSRALMLAQASLAIDPETVQALQTLAGLLHDVPSLRDRRREVEIRRRIVSRRPGDLAELIPYLTLVAELVSDPATRDPEMLRQAEDARRRFVKLLDLCIEVSHDPQLVELRRRWPS